MSRAKSDPHETPTNLGPLFQSRCGCGGLCDSGHPCPMAYAAPPVTHLFSPSDPETSQRAAVKAVQSGTVRGHTELLLHLIHKTPGQTMKFYGQEAASEFAESEYAFVWRLRLGRRTGTLKDRGLIHAEGERDGCSLWWPGPEVKP